MGVPMSKPRPRVPSEIKLELGSRQDGFMPRIKQIIHGIVTQAGTDGDPAGALQSLQGYLAGGEAMIVHARHFRTLVGFLVLDQSKGAAPFSWVDRYFRHKGLGERFYSFACINLARPAPEFRFHKDMLEEYDGVLKTVGLKPTLSDSFYVVHGGAAPTETQAPESNAELQPAALFRPYAAGDRVQNTAGGGLVIDDGHWIGFSQRVRRQRLWDRIGVVS